MPCSLFPHPPRLEPDVPLLGHPAQHFPISLRLCSVAWCTHGLEVIHAISLRWVFERSARFDMVNLYLAGMEWLAWAKTCGALDGTARAFEQYHFFSHVIPSEIFFPLERLVCEEVFPTFHPI